MTLWGGTDNQEGLYARLYTVYRWSKKWCKSLYYWDLDASMYNALVSHKYCWDVFKTGKKYK